MHKIIKLTCGDIVIGIVTQEGLVRTMKQPWEYINMGTLQAPQFVLAPYQMFLFGEHKEVTDLEIKNDQIVYEKNLSEVPDLHKNYNARMSAKSGIVV